MILFEFYCEDCKKEFEELVKPSETKVKCPYCGSHNTKKLLSAVKIQGMEGESQIAGSCSSPGGFS